MKRNICAILILIVLIQLGGCGFLGGQADTPAPTASAPAVADTPEPTPEPTPTPEPDPVAELLASMTTEEKVGQLLVAGIEGTEAGADAVQAVQEYQVGGVILFGRNVESGAQLTALNNRLKELNAGNVPLFLCVDEEGGLVSRMPPEVADLPSAYTFGQTGDPERCYQLGLALAAECRTFGFTLDFAPSLDVWSNPANTVIGKRALSTVAEEVARLGVREVDGLTDGGVVPVVKHFPGHGDTSVDSHQDLPVVDKTLEELMETELLPFVQAIDAGAPAVMVAHILEEGIDPELPASLSPKVVNGLLRETLGFDGMVCTDDLTMGAISNTYGMGEAAVLAVEAGCDLLLVCHQADNLTAARTALLEAVESGRISQERLDESVRRILTVKEEYGVTDAAAAGDVEGLNSLLDAFLEGSASTEELLP